MRIGARSRLVATLVATPFWACGGSTPTPTVTPTAVPTATASPTPRDPGDSWTALAPLGSARQEFGGALLAGKIYVVGGHPDGDTTLATGEVYDIASDRWSQLPSLPISLNHSAAAVFQGKLYLFGGQSPQIEGGLSNRTYEFDPAAQTWLEKAAMPAALSAAGADVIGDKIYVAGDTRFEVYDPRADRWELLAPVPTRRNHLTAVAIQGQLYVAGGRDATSSSVNVLERFDPVTGAWTTLAPMPTARNGHAAAAVRGCLYVMGGQTNPNDPSGVYPNNEVYDPKTNAWQTVAAMRTPRHAARASAQDDKIYVPAGAIHSGYGATTVNEVYTVPSGKSCD